MEVPQYIPALLMQFYAIWLDSIAFGICIAIPLVKNGCRLLVVGCWLSVVGCWLSVVGCWLLVVGCPLLVVWKTVPSEARVTRDEVSGL